VEEEKAEEEKEEKVDGGEAAAGGPKMYVGFLGDNCNRKFIQDLFKDFFQPTHIFIATQQRGPIKTPKGYAFVDGPAGACCCAFGRLGGL